jgi:cytochrome bd-type quinol oxidase subunit 2
MRGNVRRALVPTVAVLALVGLVAIAATGSIPGGSNETRRPPDVFFDTVLSLFILALVAGAILLVYGLMQRREVAQRYKRERSGIAFFVATFVFMLVVYLRIRSSTGSSSTPEPVGIPPASNPSQGGSEEQYEPHFAWLPVLVVVSLLAVAGIAAYLASRRRSRRDEDEAIAETLAEVLEDALDDLRAEPDPRRAVIGAYARLERALAAHGFPRRPSETQQEFLARILGRLDVETTSIQGLTELYARAKFSQHEVGQPMKEEAIVLLAEVRDQLRAAEARSLEIEVEPTGAQGRA